MLFIGESCVRGFAAYDHVGEEIMVRKIMTLALIGAGLTVAACNTVRGAGRDVQSVANCTENTMNGTRCH